MKPKRSNVALGELKLRSNLATFQSEDQDDIVGANPELQRLKRESRVLLMICGGFLLLALYVLGIGPAKKLERAGYLPPKLVDKIYQPVNLVNGTPLESALIWYLQLWFPPSYEGDFGSGISRQF